VLPLVVRRFVEQRIEDVVQLEIVALLECHPGRSWSPTEVADALRLSERDVARQLEVLGSRGLLDVRLSSEVRYRFSPSTAALASAVRQTVECYRDRRSETLAFVATRGRRALRAFSDAFRFTRDDDA
jgi:DNA-binding IclR family transcriptional regulator